MGGGDHAAQTLGKQFAEEPVPAPPARLLQVASSLPCGPGHALAAHGAGPSKPVGQASDKVRVRVRLRAAQGVVQMNDVQGSAGVELRQRVQQRHGIGSARDGDSDRAGLGQHAVALDPPSDLRQHRLNVDEPDGADGPAASHRTGARCAVAVVSGMQPSYACRCMRSLVALSLALAVASQGSDFQACESAPVYEPCEIRFEIPEADAGDPSKLYSDTVLRAEFRSPKGGRTKVMPAFWDGGNRFVLRFSPDYVGRWDYRIISSIDGLDRRTGSFQAVEARTTGFIEVFNTRYFKYPLSSKPHYWLGASMAGSGSVPWDEFLAIAEKRAEQEVHAHASLGAGDAGKRGPGVQEPGRALDRALPRAGPKGGLPARPRLCHRPRPRQFRRRARAPVSSAAPARPVRPLRQRPLRRLLGDVAGPLGMGEP